MEQVIIPLVLLFGGSGIACFVATAVVRHTAERAGLFDRPDARKPHASATPRLGGLGIVFGFAFPLLMLAANPVAAALVKENLPYLIATVASGSLVLALGIYDDVVGANAPKKLVVQVAAAVILVGFGFRFHEIHIPGLLWVDLGWFGSVASVIWIVGVINAVNFIDGIDSLATVIGGISAVTLGVIALHKGDMLALVLMTAIAGSLAGFFYWNRPPAKIFMGDSGSLFLGLIFAAVSLARPSKSPTAVLVAGPAIALALPVLDATLVVYERLRRTDLSFRQRVIHAFRADKRHVHHILLARYGSTTKAVGAVSAIALLFSAAALLTTNVSTKAGGYALAGVAILALFFFRSRSRVALAEPIEEERDAVVAIGNRTRRAS